MQYKDGIKAWLNNRKISDIILNKFGIIYDNDITIPIHDENGIFVFNKHRRNPLVDSDGPKYWYDKGGRALLYGSQFIKKEKLVVICEGELDALVLWSHNIPAVSSTGGAMTFLDSWVELLKDKEVIICLDNDPAGCAGAVKILVMIPHARVILLPNTAGVKDITDYYMKGGDLRNLIESAKHYVDYEEVVKERNARNGSWLPTTFHDAWIKWWEDEQIRNEPVAKPKEAKKYEDAVARAKEVPIRNVIKVDRQGKALCLWHFEKTPSLHVYDDNHAFCFSCGKRADVIDVVMEKEKVGFKEAIEWLNKNI